MNEPIPQGDEKVVADAQAELSAFFDLFEKKFGYSIAVGCQPEITREGYIKINNNLQLVKLPPITVAQLPANPEPATQNGDATTTETSPGDNSEQQEGKTA